MADKLTREELLELQLVETRVMLAQERLGSSAAARESFLAQLADRHGPFINVRPDGEIVRPPAEPATP
jgi:hypothetical protein